MTYPIFDLDGTLAESKQPVGEDTARALASLASVRQWAVATGGTFDQVNMQLLSHITWLMPHERSSVSAICVSGGEVWTWSADREDWIRSVIYRLTDAEKCAAESAIMTALARICYANPPKTWGLVLEDRAAQLTWSALGQEAPLDAKEEWHRIHDIRHRICAAINEQFEVGGWQLKARVGGLTSIDITKLGIGKPSGISTLCRLLGFSEHDVVYIGDAFGDGQNDRTVLDAGYACICAPWPKAAEIARACAGAKT